MRTRRTRPVVAFRPALDTLTPRICLSDITTYIQSDPMPLPSVYPTPPQNNPTIIPLPVVSTYPNGYVPPSTSPGTGDPVTADPTTSISSTSCSSIA